MSVFFCFVFFFFKQKTAYEIRLSLVGSEMCIRDQPLLIQTGGEQNAVSKHMEPMCVGEGLTRLQEVAVVSDPGWRVCYAGFGAHGYHMGWKAALVNDLLTAGH